MPYPNFHAARVRDPKDFEKIIVLSTLKNGIMIYGGPLKSDPEGPTKTQAYRFPKDKFTVEEAKQWLKDHDIKYILFEPASEGKSIYCRTLEKHFSTKEELFKALKADEDKIISIKKSQEYKSAEKGQISISGAFLKSDIAIKAGLPTKSGYVYPVINTTRYMDMHDDVHFDGLWKKSLSEQKGKIFYLSGHSMKIEDVIAWPEDVKAFTTFLDWSSVGKDYPGQTEALLFEIDQAKMKKPAAIEAIKERRKVQGSVSMVYVKIMMGIDSEEKDFAENKTYFDSHIYLIANKEKATEQGYFFGVEEAKIQKEGSMVLFGSNDATEIIYNDQPSKDTEHISEPGNPTPKTIDYKFLITNLKSKKQ